MRNRNLPEHPRFIADQMVGRLAKWLRTLGYDTLYPDPAPDDALLRIARQDARILLTRDTRLMERRVIMQGVVKAILIRGDDWKDQLSQVVRELALDPQGFRKHTYCRECNSTIESVPKETAAGNVPGYVYETQHRFSRCSECGRYYWEGTHWDEINERLSEILGGIS